MVGGQARGTARVRAQATRRRVRNGAAPRTGVAEPYFLPGRRFDSSAEALRVAVAVAKA